MKVDLDLRMRERREGAHRIQRITYLKDPENHQRMMKRLPESSIQNWQASSSNTYKNQEGRNDDRLMRLSLEKMPESSQLNVSIRSMRSKLRKTPKTSIETDMFKPNGDPFWVVSDRPPDECEKNENGEPITNSELALTLAQDGLELEEKDWFELTKSYMNFELPKGIRLPDYHKFDSLAPLEKLKDMNLYLSEKTIAYNTVQNLVELSEDAIKRFAMRREGNIGRVRSVIVQDTAEKATNTPAASIPAAPARPSREKFQLSTCIISSVNFNTQVINVQYERQNSILSIQKYRKMMSRMYSMEQTTQMESREKI
ncbi:hypothetical protein CRE_28529 [Caenorhabditis remanei]|uniref:Uncharacterized protein n=1 Tax=Caenorhabditis remanei TaxID=31234 RepID=E3LLM7_CAERE|nr:hypothetical protein CRE_28529 [Caenorhabditis remanei]